MLIWTEGILLIKINGYKCVLIECRVLANCQNGVSVLWLWCHAKCVTLISVVPCCAHLELREVWDTYEGFSTAAERAGYGT